MKQVFVSSGKQMMIRGNVVAEHCINMKGTLDLQTHTICAQCLQLYWAHQFGLVIGHEDGIRDRDDHFAEAHRLEEASGPGMADDEPCTAHVRGKVRGEVEDVNRQPVGSHPFRLATMNQNMRHVAARAFLHDTGIPYSESIDEL